MNVPSIPTLLPVSSLFCRPNGRKPSHELWKPGFYIWFPLWAILRMCYDSSLLCPSLPLMGFSCRSSMITLVDGIHRFRTWLHEAGCSRSLNQCLPGTCYSQTTILINLHSKLKFPFSENSEPAKFSLMPFHFETWTCLLQVVTSQRKRMQQWPGISDLVRLTLCNSTNTIVL